MYEHAGLEGCDVEENGLCEIDVLHPKYLPRKEMLSLLIDLLTYMTANQSVWIFLFSFCFHEKFVYLTKIIYIFLKVHTQNAVRALIAVCQSGSGKPGLAKATNEELEIIFTALKNEAECVRDATLRGLDSLEDAVPNDPSEELYTIMVISRKKKNHF